MPCGTKYCRMELDSHFSEPVDGAAIASFVTSEVAKFSLSHVLFRLRWTHGLVGFTAEVHSSMPVSKRMLNAVHLDGNAIVYHRPVEVTSVMTGAMECMHLGWLLQS